MHILCVFHIRKGKQTVKITYNLTESKRICITYAIPNAAGDNNTSRMGEWSIYIIYNVEKCIANYWCTEKMIGTRQKLSVRNKNIATGESRRDDRL